MESIAIKLYVFSGVIAFLGLFYLGIVVYQQIKKERAIDFSLKKAYDYLLGFLVLLPVATALCYMPVAFYAKGFWSPMQSQYLEAQNAMILLITVIFTAYAFVRLSMFLPHKKEYYNTVPQLLLLSLFPGVANALNVMIVSKFISADIDASYLLFFFGVTTFIYIVTVRISKRQTANLGISIAHKLNMKVVTKLFKTPYKVYEKTERGKIYTILNDDISTIFYFSQDVVNLYTAAVTSLLVLIYMFTLNIVSSLMLLGVTVFIFGLLFLFSKPLKKRGRKVLAEREQFTNLVTGLVNGFKELILHRVKRETFNNDIKKSSKDIFNARKSSVNLEIDASLFSELAFTLAIGVSCLLFPLIFTFDKEVTTAYIIVVLFLWGPVGVMINVAPHIAKAQVSWKRVKDFLKNTDEDEIEANTVVQKFNIPIVQKITVKDVCFNYESKTETTYGIGPINFEINQGELVFIIGGNGSGKTTFLKLLVGLYEPSAGDIFINDKKITNKELSECFSVIYSDFYLFKKLYDINEDRLSQVYEWLEVLQLSEKVKIENGSFSTIDLSKGQRKRLAILKSYLEDRPVYFFDEVAADLDPGFRDFFYNELLIKMRKEGKILIIISHDDKYFDLADSIYKMDMGQISNLNKEMLTLSEQH